MLLSKERRKAGTDAQGVTGGAAGLWAKLRTGSGWQGAGALFRRGPAIPVAAVTGNVRRDLEGLNRDTETAFLQVGERLRELQGMTREIGRETSAIAELVTTDETAHAAEVLDRVLVQLRQTAEQDAIAARVHLIQENAKAIRKAADHMGGIAKVFNVLGMVTRIESARLETSSVDFVDLADDVLSLSSRIRDQLTATAASAQALYESASGAETQTRTVTQHRRKTLGPLSERVTAGLVQLREHRRRCADSAELVAGRFEQVAGSIAQVIMALQCQDITRQQIEHVLEALHPVEAAGSRYPATAGQTVRLQAAQLDHSREAFAGSINQIEGSLLAIDRNIADTGVQVAGILGLSGADRQTSFTAMERDLGSVLTILTEYAQGGKHMEEIGRSVASMLAGMSERIADVDQVGTQMRRISLNAAVQAARLGTKGETLETIAGAIQRLARESSEICVEMEERLRQMRETAIVQEADTSGREQSEERLEDLRRVMQGFGPVQQATEEHYANAVALSERLNQHIRQTVETFATQKESVDVLAEAAGALRDLSPAMGGSSPAALDGAFTYTMHAERAVHEAVARGEAAVPVAAAAAVAVADDNVEFF